MGEIERQLKRAQEGADAADRRAPGAESTGDAVVDLLVAAQQFEDARRHIENAIAELESDGNWEDGIRTAFESAGHAAAALEHARVRLDAVALVKLLGTDGADQPGEG